MRVLITGGAGFIGMALSRALLRREHQVALLDSLHPQVHPSACWPPEAADGIPLFLGDVARRETWPRVLTTFEPDVVVHLAAETGTGQSLHQASRHARVNVLGTTRLLDALAAEGAMPRRILLSSSRAVYGEGCWQDAQGRVTYPGGRSRDDLATGRWDFTGPGGEKLHPLPQAAAETVPRPSSVYGATKLAQEHVLLAWCSGHGVNCSILRMQNVIGWGQAVENSYTGVLTYFAAQALRGRPLPVFEDGAIIRDFVDVEDVASAMVAAVESPPDADHIVDIGSGRATTLLAVATLIAEKSGGPPPQVTGEYRLGDVRAAMADIRAAQDQLGWRPARDLATSLDSLMAWVGSRESPG